MLAVADLVLDIKRYELDAAEPVLDRKYDGAVKTDILRVRHALPKEMSLSSTYGLDKRRSGHVDEKNVLIFDDVAAVHRRVVFEVKATTHLCVENFDNMVDFFVVEFNNGGGVIRVLVLASSELRRQLYSANFLVARTSPQQKLLTLSAVQVRSGIVAVTDAVEGLLSSELLSIWRVCLAFSLEQILSEGKVVSLYNTAVHRPFRCSWNFGVLSATPFRFSGIKKKMDGLVFCGLVVLDLPRLDVP